MKHKFKIALFVGMLLLALFSACQSDDLDGKQTEQTQETIKVSAEELLGLINDPDIKKAILEQTSIKKSNDGLRYFEKLDFADFDNYTLFVNNYTAETPYYKALVVTIDNEDNGNAFYVTYTPTDDGYTGEEPFNIHKFNGKMGLADLDGNPVTSWHMQHGEATPVPSGDDCETTITISIVPCSHGDGHQPGETCSQNFINDSYYLVNVTVNCGPKYLFAGGGNYTGGSYSGGSSGATVSYSEAFLYYT